MQLSDSLQLAAAWFRVLDDEQKSRVERDLTVQQASAGSIIERKANSPRPGSACWAAW